MSIKMHPRTHDVIKATSEFTQFFIALEEKYKLTFGEMYSILGERIARLAKDEIQLERQPTKKSKKGDDA